ncbi:hypothetical protein ACLOJK_005359 [Asimina triloba]
MEAREGIGSGMPGEASGSFHTSVKVEDSGLGLPATAMVTPVSLPMAERKKRGRPRKYGPDGGVALALSPMPISASAPPAGAVGPTGVPAMGEFLPVKRGRGRPVGSTNKPKHFSYDSGDGCSVGADFMPHVITVAAGEDVTMKIISFSQQGPRAICILSANGAISNVTLRQPDSSGGTLTYEAPHSMKKLSAGLVMFVT